MIDRQYGINTDTQFVMDGGITYVILWVEAFMQGLAGAGKLSIYDNITGGKWAEFQVLTPVLGGSLQRGYGLPCRHTLSNRLSTFEGWTYKVSPGSSWDVYLSGYKLADPD
jgi:hypothetical protein